MTMYSLHWAYLFMSVLFPGACGGVMVLFSTQPVSGKLQLGNNKFHWEAVMRYE